MLAKQYRLPIQQFTKKSGRTRRDRFFLVKIFPPERPFSRFGVIISTKVSKKATERNQIKRQIFNFIRTRQNQISIADYLFITFPSIIQLDENQLIVELTRALELRSMKYELRRM